MEAKQSSTAFAAAKMRAAHLLLDADPKIFRDDFALRFSGSESEASLRDELDTMRAEAAAKIGPEAAENLFRSIRAIMICRGRYTEEALTRAIARGVRRYVILGAGLDSFAWRHPELVNDVEVFEIDHPANQEWKRRRLSELRINPPPNLIFLPIDFEKQTLTDRLRERGFRLEEPAFFSWLGVTQYLKRETVLAILKQVAALPHGTEISFTFLIPPALMADQQGFAIGAAMAAARGEPWLSFFEAAELTSRLKELGLAHVTHFTPEDANASYFAGRGDGLRAPDGEHLMLAQVE
jgi:methyltransferase (TIGR00027 family)